MNSTVTFKTIDEETAGQRIDNYLLTALKGLPKSRIYNLLRKGEIRVNKKRISADYRLKAQDEIRIPPIRLPDEVPLVLNTSLFEGLRARILYEDQHLLVINKPQGIAVHGGTAQPHGLIECLKQGFNNEKMELIHRLDKDTSGCLLIAKTRTALKFYHQQFRERGLQKRYLALVYGRWPEKKQTVDLPLLRSAADVTPQKVRVSEEGQQAITHFSIIQYVSNATLLEATLVTGRTHQIRVHTSVSGHPIIGDEKYGSRKFDKAVFAEPVKRLFLHAASVTFPLMEEKGKITIKAEVDNHWQHAISTLKKGYTAR